MSVSLLIVFLAAAAGPLLAPARHLLLGILGLTVVLTAMTVWGMASSAPGDAQGARYAALAIAGLVTGSVVRLAFFVWKASVEDQLLRRELGRELPERHR